MSIGISEFAHSYIRPGIPPHPVLLSKLTAALKTLPVSHAPKLPWKIRKLDESIWADVTDGEVAMAVLGEDPIHREGLKLTERELGLKDADVGNYTRNGRYVVGRHIRVDNLPMPGRRKWHEYGVIRAALGLKDSVDTLKHLKAQDSGSDVYQYFGMTPGYLEGVVEEIKVSKKLFQERRKRLNDFVRTHRDEVDSSGTGRGLRLLPSKPEAVLEDSRQLRLF